MQTVVGLYRSIAEANQVKQALVNEGYNGGDVTVIDQSESGYNSGSNYETVGAGVGTGSAVGAGSGVSGLTGDDVSITNTNTGSNYGSGSYGSGSSYGDSTTGETGVGSKIKHFFQNLTGHDEHTHRAYTEGVSRGGALVAVNVSEGEAERAAGILRQYGATDIEGDESYGSRGTGADYGTSAQGGSVATTGLTGDVGAARTGANTVAGEQVIPVVEEELVVGKREVERGGVRVYSRVVSEPVSESVNLHEERVVVDRRPVDRAATEADFRDAGPIEVRATGEEAVVGKTGRVVEEVLVGKTATDRTETVNDTVRHTEVDVQPVNTGVGTTGTGTSSVTGTTGSTTGTTGTSGTGSKF